MPVKHHFTKKRIIIGVISILVILGITLATRGGGNTATIQTDTVKQQDIKRTVLATGTVTSSSTLELSFKNSGKIAQVNTKVGSVVKAGDILAALDQRDANNSIAQASAALLSARAAYDKVVNGATGPEVDIAKAAVISAEVTLNNAKKNYATIKSQQDIAIANAKSALLNSALAAVPLTSNVSTATVTISGTYTGTAEGVYNLTLSEGGTTAVPFKYAGIETGNGFLTRGIAQPFGTKGLFITVSTTGTIYPGDTWQIAIPNTQAATYLANLNSYQSAQQAATTALATAQATIDTAEASLGQAQAQLALKQSQARPEDVAAARAQVATASAQLSVAQTTAQNNLITAPIDGIITKVDAKPGEVASALKSVITILDEGNLHVEANISEANIAQLKLGQEVDVTFDAFGPDRHFKATIASIDPASTVVSGVVNYKITASLEKVDEIKPGLTANMSVLTAEQKNATTVPLRSVINRDGKKLVRVITNLEKKTYEEKEVTTGLEADGGLVQITGGLTADETIVTFIEEKK